jgi:enamine deaminase RidA (YjgF/YER057c/UK114 family)
VTVHSQIIPQSIAPPVANYALGVLSSGSSRWLHTAGVVGIRPDGSVPPTIGEQAEVIWASFGAILAEAEMGATDVVSITTYAVVGEDPQPVMAARDAYFGEHRAASTLVYVPALARPEWLVEIAIVAAAA